MFALGFAGAVGVWCAFAAAACRVAQRHNVRVRFRERAPLVIVAFSLAAQAAALWRYPGPLAITTLIAIAAAGVASVTDLQTGYIFDAVTVPSVVGIWIAAAIDNTLAPSVAGAAVAGGIFAALYVITWGRGIGLGDGKLAACVGGALGMQKGVVAIEIAFVLGGACAAFLLIRRRAGRGAEIRFAPYIAAGLLGAMLCP